MRGKTNQDFCSIVKIRKIIFRDVITISFWQRTELLPQHLLEKKNLFSMEPQLHMSNSYSLSNIIEDRIFFLNNNNKKGFVLRTGHGPNHIMFKFVENIMNAQNPDTVYLSLIKL